MFAITDIYLYTGFVYLVTFVASVCLLWKAWFKTSITLNCWFCGNNNAVPRHSKLWWLCTICEQYNGFTASGDYLKLIPEMFKQSANVSRKVCATPPHKPKETNILCVNCQDNQSQIVQALSEFSPSDERHFNEELEDYEIELNRKYSLCISCRTAVSFHLQNQNQDIQRTHNENFETYTKTEKPPRRLNVELNNGNSFFPCVYKVTHVLSLLAAIWLWQKKVLDTGTNFILINTSLIYPTGTFFTYFYAQKLNLVGVVVSAFWLLILAYGNFKTGVSRSLRINVLSLVVILECLYLCYGLLHFFSKVWRSMMYKKERKEKVGRLKDSPSKLEADGVKPPVKNDTMPDKQDTNLSLGKEGTILRKRPSTPDILEGHHLDSMFIQRKPQTSDFSHLKDAKDANHVIAALKYQTATSTVQNSHRVAGQLLKPATLSAKLFKPGVFSGRQFTSKFSVDPLPINFSGNMLRPATFISPANNVIPDTNSINSKDSDNYVSHVSRMRISSESSDNNATEEKLDLKNDNNAEEVVVGVGAEQTIWKRLKWSSICIFTFAFILVFSVICNLVLVYQLAFTNKA